MQTRPAVAQAALIVTGVILIGYSPAVGILLSAVWLLPVVIAIDLGLSRERTGWMWGLFLSWLGVFILACMRARPPALEPETTVSPELTTSQKNWWR